MHSMNPHQETSGRLHHLEIGRTNAGIRILRLSVGTKSMNLRYRICLR